MKPNAIIIGTGKIGIDLYIKLKKSKFFGIIYILNRNRFSEGAKYCQKKKFNYSSGGIDEIKRKIKNFKFIFDCTSAESNKILTKKLNKHLKDIYYFNLTPSKFGKYVIPYLKYKNIPKKINLITCGGQTSIPIIVGIRNILNRKLNYVELVSSISAKSAGQATRANIDEYITNTENAIKQITNVNKTKVIINISPTTPPINMMNSLYFETKKKISKKEFSLIKKEVKNVNIKIKFYIPGYNALVFNQLSNNIIRITIRVVGRGDYLPKYAGNLDIITSAAMQISKQINN